MIDHEQERRVGQALEQAYANRKATIGKRNKADRDLSDATCTPKWLADLLPEVDFDPCSNPRSHIRSRWAWSLEKGFDGIKMPWRGDGFINWPFSSPKAWAVKANYELSLGRCTGLIILCKMDPSPDWWKIATAPIMRAGAYMGVQRPWHPDLWLFHDRVEYDEHPDLIARRVAERAVGIKKGKKDGSSSANFCSAIIHHRFNSAPLALELVADRWERSVRF